jgi:threonine aldolase
MKNLPRRNFLKLSSFGALIPTFYTSEGAAQNQLIDEKNLSSAVDFTSDGMNLSPAEYAQLLAEVVEKNNIQADYYSQNGCIEKLEAKFAQILGKESAIFMPTGTLANHLAIRTLAGKNNRAIVQNESHVYNDTGDCVQTLSNLNLIPLGTDKATFSVDDVNELLKRTAGGRVASKIGVISIESPVRRKTGEMFDYQQMKLIADLAKKNDIKMHLDGARIFLASAYTGITPAEYSSLFDTIYVSLYKYFNAASGAILAGSKEVIAPLFHARRMFGSGLHQAWPFAAVALHYFDGFLERYAKAVKISEELIAKLKAHPRFEIERIANGTNISKLTVKGISAAIFAENLKRNGIIVRPNGTNTVNLLVNETLNRSNAAKLESIFINSLN